jgi:hypothetical protein
MEEKGSNGKPKPQSVLESLPTTRPERLGRPRAGAKRTKTSAGATKPAGGRAATAVRPKTAPLSSARTTAASRRPRPPTRERPHGPAAVTAGCPPLERPHLSEPPPEPIGPPKGTELVTTAIQATGELARIGLTVGGQVLKRAVDRLPRP